MKRSSAYYSGLTNELNAAIEDLEREEDGYVAKQRIVFLFEVAAEAIDELRPAGVSGDSGRDVEAVMARHIERARRATAPADAKEEKPSKKSPRYPKPCTNGRHRASDGPEQRCIKCGQLPKGAERQTTVPGAS